MITLEKVLHLGGVPLFAGLGACELGRIASLAEETQVAARTRVIVAGDHAECMYSVVEGSLRVHAHGRLLRTLGPRTYFGELSLIDGAPRSASVTAETDCLLLRLGQTAFQHVLELHPGAALVILRNLTGRLRRLEQSVGAPCSDELGPREHAIPTT